MPEICKNGGLGLPTRGVTAVVEVTTGAQTCANAEPPIPLNDAQAKCKSVGDATLIENCIIDYCGSEGDDAAVENVRLIPTRRFAQDHFEHTPKKVRPKKRFGPKHLKN